MTKRIWLLLVLRLPNTTNTKKLVNKFAWKDLNNLYYHLEKNQPLKIPDSVITTPYNINYFKDSVSSKGIIDFIYKLQYANVNNGSYPLTGKTWFASLQKRGLGFTGGINMLQLEAGYNKYFDILNYINYI